MKLSWITVSSYFEIKENHQNYNVDNWDIHLWRTRPNFFSVNLHSCRKYFKAWSCLLIVVLMFTTSCMTEVFLSWIKLKRLISRLISTFLLWSHTTSISSNLWRSAELKNQHSEEKPSVTQSSGDTPNTSESSTKWWLSSLIVKTD